MLERDKVKESELGTVVKYALSEPFYRTIIFSPKNLRKHYRAILTKMNTAGGGHGKHQGNISRLPQTSGTNEKQSATVAEDLKRKIANFE
ncbi:hypothetical protein D3C75_1210950 [compost metagenome]